jgi:hypothetical protein
MGSRRTAALLLVLAVAACTSAGPPAGTIPTIEEAQAHLAEIVRLARAGNFEEMCALGDGNCERILEVAGRDAVPRDPPTIVATRTVPTTSSSGQQSFGGVVFVLCGIDGRGDHYDAEMLVFHDGNGLRAMNPVYWGRTRIASSPQTESTFEPVAC